MILKIQFLILFFIIITIPLKKGLHILIHHKLPLRRMLASPVSLLLQEGFVCSWWQIPGHGATPLDICVSSSREQDSWKRGSFIFSESVCICCKSSQWKNQVLDPLSSIASFLPVGLLSILASDFPLSEHFMPQICVVPKSIHVSTVWCSCYRIRGAMHGGRRLQPLLGTTHFLPSGKGVSLEECHQLEIQRVAWK